MCAVCRFCELFFFFFKQKTAYEMLRSLVGSEMCIRDRCIYNLCFAFLDPGDVALASDPGYPVYTGGPILALSLIHI